jgi:uncharacterized protein YjiS (DUF1127 family)
MAGPEPGVHRPLLTPTQPGGHQREQEIDMGHAQTFDAAPHEASRAFGVLQLTQRAWAAYWAHRAERATVAMLRSLDDRALKDIGLDRSEIESVVYGGREDGRSTATDQARSAERRIGMCL